MRSFYFKEAIPKQRQGDGYKSREDNEIIKLCYCLTEDLLQRISFFVFKLLQWRIPDLRDQLGNSCLSAEDLIFKHVLEKVCLKKDLLDLEEKRNCMSDWIKKVIISIIGPFPRDRKRGQEMAALIAWEGK